jgi:hypothetical protein
LLAQMGYETRDIALNTLVRWLVFLGVFIIVMMATAYVTYKVFVPNWVETERTAPLEHVRKIPPYPQLQADPRRDIIEFRQAEDDVVNGYTAGGPKGQRTNVPIATAIDILANQRGIAGIRGSQAKPESEAYPGSGIYTTGQPRSDNMAPDDATTSGRSATGLTVGAPQAGGTGEGRTSVPGQDRTAVSAPVSGTSTQPGAQINGPIGPDGQPAGSPPETGSSAGAVIPAQPAPAQPEAGSGGRAGSH